MAIGDQFHFKLGVVAGHDHLHAFLQLDDPGHVVVRK